MKLRKRNLNDLITKDQTLFVRHFQQRLIALMSEVILKEDGPLGNVIHYFYCLDRYTLVTCRAHILLKNLNENRGSEGVRAASDITHIILMQHRLMEDTTSLFSRRRRMRSPMREIVVDGNCHMGDVEVYRREVSFVQMNHNLNTLNSEQREIYNMIMDYFGIQVSGTISQKINTGLSDTRGTEPIANDTRAHALRLIVSGMSGTGKTFLANLLADTLVKRYGKESNTRNPVVLIASPT